MKNQVSNQASNFIAEQKDKQIVLLVKEFMSEHTETLLPTFEAAMYCYLSSDEYALQSLQERDRQVWRFRELRTLIREFTALT